MLHVLFVCEHNSARSQMAESFLKHLGNGDFRVDSCGLEAGTVNPLVIEAMGEIGHDLRGATTRSVLDLLNQGRRYDLVITVCSRTASEQCPLFPGRSLRLNWPFADPSALEGDRESQLKEIRVIRDAIRRQVEAFLAEYRARGLAMFL